MAAGEATEAVTAICWFCPRDFHSYTSFLSMALAINLLQSWEGIGNWLSKAMSEAALSDKELAQMGPADAEAERELDQRVERLERHTKWTLSARRGLGIFLAAVIYGLTLVMPPTAEVTWLGMIGIALLGFGMPLYYIGIIATNRARSALISRWLNKKTRQAAARAKKDQLVAKEKLLSKVQRRRYAFARARGSPGTIPARPTEPPQRPLTASLLMPHLAAVSPHINELFLSFSEIEQILRAPLPASARRDPDWWLPHSQWVGPDWIMWVATSQSRVRFRRMGKPSR